MRHPRVTSCRYLSYSLARLSSAAAVCAALTAFHTSTKAANLNWDPAGDQTNSGGLGTWDLTSLFWNDDGIAPNVLWPNLLDSVAIFGGTGGAVTINTAVAGTGVSAHGLTFNVDGYTIASDEASELLTLVGTAPTINVTTGTATISSVLAGTNGLVVTGAGTLNLRSALANSFLGDLLISSGRVDFQADNQLGDANNDIFLNGGRLDYTSATADWDPAASRVINIGAAGGTLGGSRAIRITDAGQIVGSGNLIREATGTTFGLDLQQANVGFTGNTILNNGVIEFRNSNAFGNTPGQSVTVNGGRLVIAPFTGNFVPTLSQPVTLSGGAIGFGNQLGGTYAGNVNVTVDSSIIVNDFYQNANRGGAIGGILSGSNKLTISGVTTGLVAGTPSIGSVLLTNPGNTYSGTFSIGAGAHVRSIQGGGIDTLASSTIELNGGGLGLGPVTTTSGSGAGFFARHFASAKINNGVAGGFDFGAETPLYARTEATINYPTAAPAANLANSGSIWTGILQVTAGGTYAFSTRTDDGSMVYVNGQQIVSNDFSQGATERFGSINLTPGFYPIIIKYGQGGGGASAQAFYAGPDTANNKVILGSIANTVSNNGGALFGATTMDNNINVIAGGGDIDLAGANATSTGQLGFAAGASLRITGVTGLETLTHSGAVTLNGNNTISAGITLTGNQTNNFGHSSAGADFVISGNIGQAASGSGFTKTGPRTLTLTGTNTFSGPVTVSEGKLVGNTLSLPTAITNNSILEFNQPSDGTLSNSVSGTGSFIKSGSGALAISGAKTYTGSTTVTEGTLTGTGSLTSTVTVRPKATIAGAAGSTFTMSGLVLNPNSNASFGLGAPSATPLLASTGGFSGGGTTNIAVTDLGGLGVGTYRLIDYTGPAPSLSQFAGFGKVSGPSSFFYGVVNNTIDTSIDLTVEAPGVLNTWTGATDGVWDTTTANWSAGNFASGQRVTFGDGPTNRTITGGSVSPQGIVASSGAGTDYSIANPITGTLAAGLQKSGASTLRLTGANTFTGGINVTGGTLRANVSTAASSLGASGVTLGDGATLQLDPLSSTVTNGVSSRYITTAANATAAPPSNTAGVDFTQSSAFGIPVAVQTDTNFDPAAYSTTNRPAGGAVGFQEGTGTNWRSFGVERTGQLNITAAGWYAFYTGSDDGSKVFIDGNLVANTDGGHGVVDGAGTVLLSAGIHDFRYEFVQGTGGADERIQWAGPGIARATIPSSAVFVAETATVAGSSNNVTIGTPITTSGNSTINLNGSQFVGVNTGQLNTNGGTVNILSDNGKNLRATGTALNGSLTLNNTANVALGRVDDSGVPTTLTKTGSGLLVLDNTAAGGDGSNLSAGSIFNIQEGTLRAVGSSQPGATNPLGLSTVRLNGGNLQLDTKVGAVGFSNPIDVLSSGRLSVNTIAFQTMINGPVSIATGQTLTLDVAGGARNGQGGYAAISATTTAMINGVISGGGGLSIESTQTNGSQLFAAPNITLAANPTYTGLTKFAGFAFSQPQLELRGDATLLSTSGVNAVGKLSLTNSRLNIQNAAGFPGNRIVDSWPVELNTATIRIDGADINSVNETVGPVTLKGGQINFLGGQVAGTAFNTLTAASITRENRATLRLDANNIGGLAVANGVRFLSTDATGFNEIGGGGSTATNVGIIPWVWGAPTGNNRSLVTYDTNGLRTLGDAEYTTLAASTSATDNIRPTFAAATTIGSGAAQTINSFVPTNTGTADFTLTLAAGTVLNVTSGAVLLNNTDATARRITLTGGNINFGAAEGVIVASRREHLFQTQLSGSNGLTVTGDGQLTLDNLNNNFTGLITVTGNRTPNNDIAQLNIQNDGSLGNADNDLRIDGAGIRLNTAFTLNANRTLTIGAAGATFDTGGGTTTVAGQVTGPGDVYKLAGNNLVLTNSTNNYAGETYLFNGNLTTNTGPQGDIHLFSSSNGTLTFDQTFSGTYAGNIDGTGSFIKSGTGVATLTGDLTYVGTTSINAGALLLEGSINGSTTTVATGATLGGSGDVNTVLSVSGTLAPGASAGDLLVSRALTFNTGSSFSLELNGSTAGTGYDQLTISNTGTVTINGGNLSLALNFEPSIGQQFMVIENLSASPITGTFANLSNGGIISATFNSVQFDFVANYSGGSGNDLVLSVPEPTAMNALLTGLGLCAGLRRFRRFSK